MRPSIDTPPADVYADEDISAPKARVTGPAAAIANVMQTGGTLTAASPPPEPAPELPRRDSRNAVDVEDGPSPVLPARPVSAVVSSEARVPTSFVAPSSPRDTDVPVGSTSTRAPGGFHMYNVNEMVSVMGKRKKMPTTIGVNIETKTILIAPEHSKDGPSQEWTGDRMTHYSREGKHVFLELVRPSKSVDFHAGAKDTAEEIVLALGELAAAVRADGLSIAILSPTGRAQKRGQVLYDFTAQGDDEVTVNSGDDVIILDDTKSDEWWQVRRIKNGKEGVVPSSYVEVTGFVSPQPTPTAVNSARSTVEQNRLDEIRLTKEAVNLHGRDQVGPGMPLPDRGSSLQGSEHTGNSSQQRRKRDVDRDVQPKGQKSSMIPLVYLTCSDQDRVLSFTEPDPSKVRTWTDRSKSFSVEAQFLGMKDGKINLHKVNGVKIAVPVAKMSFEDLDYVERLTGTAHKLKQGAASQAGASVEQRKPDYDWFQFFLDCDVNVGLCERYAQAFAKESMDESVLSDVDASVLRTLGLREGDIIKVMRALDGRFGRPGKASKDGADGEGGLFSGPGGTLRNNTRKGRPAPAVQTTDVVDPKAFTRADSEVKTNITGGPVDSQTTVSGGFDDDAWDVKPAKQATPTSQPTPVTSEKPATSGLEPSQNLTGSMQDLSLLAAPLKPTPAQATSSGSDPGSSTLSSTAVQSQTPPTQQPSGATPSFFSTLDQSGGLARQRPQPPSQSGSGQGTLAPPPPARPLSAPHAAQSSAFSPPPIAPQMTGSVHPSLQGHVAPPGQSLNEVDQARLRDQYLRQLQAAPQMPSYGAQNHPSGLVPLPTGIQGQLSQPLMTGSPSIPGSQFAGIQPQPTGFSHGIPPQQPLSNPTGGAVNSFLPPALEPQRTGMPGLPGTLATVPAPAPPAPLMPQQTGPAPSVRFGVKTDTPKVKPQPTGRRANLAQASMDTLPLPTPLKHKIFLVGIRYVGLVLTWSAPDNPFGF